MSSTTSRRNFFGTSIKIAGAAGAALTLDAQTATPSDIDILNYALTLEHLEAAFYVEGLGKYSASDFAGAMFIGANLGTGAPTADSVYRYFTAIRDHETAHVQTLTTVIKQLGGTPVSAAKYDFGYKNVDEFVKVAQALENTGVMAYDGAIAGITAPALRTAGATIATVEARHASYLNLLNGTSPFPSAFDTPKTMAEILAIAGPFIVGGGPTPPPTPTLTAMVTPNMLVTGQFQVVLDATASTGVNTPLMYLYSVKSGGKIPALLQSPSNPKVTVQFASGPGDYFLMLTVTDSKGGTATQDIKLTYQIGA